MTAQTQPLTDNVSPCCGQLIMIRAAETFSSSVYDNFHFFCSECSKELPFWKVLDIVENVGQYLFLRN